MKTIARLEEPYKVLVADDLIPMEFYRSLMRTFPVGRARPFDYAGGLKENFNQSAPDFAEFVNGHREWLDFYNAITPIVMRDVAPKMGVAEKQWFMKFEFSMLPRSGGLKPHPDGANKTMTGVFYFPPEDWLPEWGGNFEVARHKTNPYGDFTKSYTEWEDVETVLSAAYKPNRAVFMVRTPYSLHGVRPIQCPVGHKRLSLTINWI